MDNITLIIFATLSMSVPFIAAGLGGLFSERSGVVNIGLEGMMTFGAFVGAATIVWFETQFGTGFMALVLGTITAILGGALFGALHAWLSIRWKLDQIISGTAINIAALAISIYLCGVFYFSAETPSKLTPSVKIFGELYLIVIIIFILAIVTDIVINKTKFGMRLIAVGENPQAADAMGINVNKVRYQAVIISGALAGIAGISVILTTTGRFGGYAIAGKGFIALAVMLFGRRNAYGIIGAGLLFGFTSTLGTYINIIVPNLPIPSVYFTILPYVVTIIALVLLSRKSVDPEGLGQAYDKEVR